MPQHFRNEIETAKTRTVYLARPVHFPSKNVSPNQTVHSDPDPRTSRLDVTEPPHPYGTPPSQFFGFSPIRLNASLQSRRREAPLTSDFRRDGKSVEVEANSDPLAKILINSKFTILNLLF